MPTYPANIPAIHRKNRPIAAVLRMTAAAAGAASTKRTRPWVDRKACHAISAPLNAIAGSNRAIGRITIYISVAACPELDRLMEDVIQTAAMPRTIASATPKDGFRSHQRGRSGGSSASSGSVDAPADLTLCSEDTYTTSHKNCQHRMHNNGLVMRKDSFGAKIQVLRRIRVSRQIRVSRRIWIAPWNAGCTNMDSFGEGMPGAVARRARRRSHFT